MSKLPTYLLNGKVIAKPLNKKEEILDSGTIIPESANSNLQEGLVVLVDQQIEKYVKKGDIVVYPTGSGTGQLIDGEPHLWLSITDLWAGFQIDEEDA